MKTYTDFISDLTINSKLLQELEAVLPFPNANHLQSWFSSQGYDLAEGDVAMLYQNQNCLMSADEQINY